MRPIKFRAISLKPKFTIIFTLDDLVNPNPPFSIRELLIPWLKAGNKPDEFTGLLDKNGKEIYEGDVIKFETLEAQKNETKILPVERIENYLGFRAREKGWASWMFYGERTEVVGNVWEHPEPLKGGQNE